MNVYDFDGTIYQGDSTFDFYIFSIKNQPRVILCLPRQIWGAIQFYILRSITLTAYKEKFYVFLGRVNGIDELIQAFWDVHISKIAPWYLAQKRDNDLVITASPEFLIGEACKRLHICHPIGSVVDPYTGVYSGVNCKGREKVIRFQQKYAEGEMDAFYSDSYGDKPLAQIARESFLVKGDHVVKWE